MSTTITPTEQNIEINVNNDVIDINVTNEIVDVNATTQQINIDVFGAYPLPSPVLSVFGRTGVVVATEGDYTLTQLGDVTLTSPTNGQVLKYNGTTWVNGTDAGGLTSVGLSMPTAFTVTNSPLTSNGTISITGAGTTAQYVRGDGTLATFPSIITQAQNLVTEVYNRTGATLTKGTIVYINGGQGNLPTVTKALATGDSTSAQTYGVVQSDITNMNNGYVVVAGRLIDLDTQAYTEGTQLYLSSTTAGTWTSTKQYAPAHLVYVGIVVRAHPTQGIVEIKIQNGYELDEIHNVAAQTPTNNDGLFWESATNLWKNKSIATILGGTPVTGTGTTNYLAKFTGSSTIGTGQILDDGTSVLIGTTSSTPNVKVGIYSTTQRALEVVSTNSNALFVQSPAAFIATISNGTWVTNFTNTGRLDLAGDLLVNTIANATTDTDRFLVSDSGVIKYRTGAELLSDIGGQGALTNPITGTGTSGQVAYFNGTNSITSNAAFAFTPTSQLLVNNSVTAASAIARGTNLTPTLTAAANNDVLVGLDINPTFSNAAFTGVSNIPLRINLSQNASTLFVINNTTSGTASESAIQLLSNSGNLFQLGKASATKTAYKTISGGDGYIYNSLSGNLSILNDFSGGNINLAANGSSTPQWTLNSNGTVTQTGNFSQNGLTLSFNQNASTIFTVSNTTAGTFSQATLYVTSDASSGTGQIFKYSSSRTAYKNIGASALGFYNATAGNISILNDFASGNINFAAGGASTAQATLFSTGNFALNTVTDAGFRLDVNGTIRSSGIIYGGTFTPGAGLQATDYFATTGRVRAGNGISFRGPNNADNNTIGVFPDGSSGAAGVDIFSANNKVFNFSWLGNSVGNAYQIFQSYTTSVSSGNINTLSITPTIGATVANTVVYRGILYNPTINNLNGGTHRAIETVTGDVLLGTTSGNVAIGTSTLATATELTLGGSQTASSAIARGQLLNTTLVAAANNDVLIGLDINPTFTNGAFTSIRQYAARFNRDISVGNKGQWTTYTLSNNIFLGNSYITASNQGSGGDLYIGANYYYNGTIGTNVGSGFSTLIGLNPNNDGRTLFYTSGNNAAGATVTLTTSGTIFQTGNWLLGTGTTDAGFRLDVNGTARVVNTLTVGSNGVAAGRIELSRAAAGTAGYLYMSSNNFVIENASQDIIFSTAGIEKMRLTGTTGGNLLINTTTDVASSILTINSTTKGFLPPRMTTTQRNAISSPATGLVVYDTTDNELDYHNGTAWQSLMTLGTQQTVTGFKQFSASRTASLGVAQGTLMTPTLTASANNDVLVGLDISPTYSNGAFTGVTNTALRVIGNTNITGTLAIGNTVTSASSVSSTHKVSIIIGGVQYYLLASNV